MCVPPEVEQVEGEGGTDFESAEGGGFDEGLGTKNVSSEVDAENLVRTQHAITNIVHSCLLPRLAWDIYTQLCTM